MCSPYWLYLVSERNSECSGLYYLYRFVLGDYHTDSERYKFYRQYFPNEISCWGITVLMIAHRLSTITDADKIVVVKDGQIVDEGTHEELLISCTLYQEMWKAHMDTKDAT